MPAPKGNLFAIGNNGGRPLFKVDNMMLAIKCKCCGEVKNYIYFPNSRTNTGITRKCIKCTHDSYHPITRNVRRRISSALKDNKKLGTTIDLLGIDIDGYKQYLEKQFTKKMSWDNYGTYWHIDHIIPVSKFNLDNEYEQRQAFHYTNTQPLTAKENISKNNRTIHDQFKLIM